MLCIFALFLCRKYQRLAELSDINLIPELRDQGKGLSGALDFSCCHISITSFRYVCFMSVPLSSYNFYIGIVPWRHGDRHRVSLNQIKLGGSYLMSMVLIAFLRIRRPSSFSAAR